MIKLTRFQGKEYYVNSDLIETIEETPDTVITLTTGRKIMVKERADEVLQKIVEFRKVAFPTLTVIHREKKADEVE